MLKADVYELCITPEIRARLEPKILGALFSSLTSVPATRKARMGIPMLTVSQAMERLQAELPAYAPIIGEELPFTWRDSALGPVDVGNKLHEWIKEGITFFRQQGAYCIKEGLSARTLDEFYNHVWKSLFDERLLSLAQSSKLLEDQNSIQTCDILMECLKLWTKRLCKSLYSIYSKEELKTFEPNSFFLDVESELEATISLGPKQRLTIRGRPDAVFFDHKTGEVHLWEYKFGRQGQYELKIAQVLLYLSIMENAKGIKNGSGFLCVFRPVEDTNVPNELLRKLNVHHVQPPFPPAVEKAFEGYIGNEPAVYQLKVDLTLALRESPPRMPENIMLCGSGGLGKTELARRVARALGTPFIDVPAPQLSDLNYLISLIDNRLESQKVQWTEIGQDSGKPLIKYPPLVIFIDEAHELKKRADSYLNFFEPKERRAFGKDHVGDFKDATILLATTDKGKLSKPFLTRFRIIDLVPYSVEEIAQIIKLTLGEKCPDVDPNLCRKLAKIGRLIPRSAIEKARHFMKFHTFSPSDYPLTEAGLRKMMEQWGVGEEGLTINDRRYLKVLENRPCGIDSLTSLLDLGKEEILTVIEPYLFQLGFIKATTRGREITELGRKVLVS